jgi:hypothetical protein
MVNAERGGHLLVLEVEEHVVLQDEPSRLPVLHDVPYTNPTSTGSDSCIFDPDVLERGGGRTLLLEEALLIGSAPLLGVEVELREINKKNDI